MSPTAKQGDQESVPLGSGDRAASPDAPNRLQRLIRGRLDELGWSYGTVARRGGLPRSTVYNLATTQTLGRPPRTGTIERLAKGLDLPVSVVRAAAAEATGLHYGELVVDDETAVLLAGLEELTPEDRRVVAALVESLRARSPGLGRTPRRDSDNRR